MTDQEAHDELSRLAEAHHQSKLALEGDNAEEDAAAGTMQGDAPPAPATDLSGLRLPEAGGGMARAPVASLKAGLQSGRTKLGGVNPPDPAEAAAGTMKSSPLMDAINRAASTQAEAEPDLVEPDSDTDDTKAGGGTMASTVRGNVGAMTSGAAAKPFDTSKPIGLPMHDTELAGLQKDSADRASTATLGRAVEDYANRPDHLMAYAQRLGGGGAPAIAPRSKIWDDFEAAGPQAIKDLEMRRKSESEMATKAGTAAALSDRKDPNSMTAKMYLAALPPEYAAKLQGANAEQIEKAIPWIQKFAEEHQTELRDKVAADEKKAADVRDQSKLDESVRHGTTADTETERHNRATEETAAAVAAAKKKGPGASAGEHIVAGKPETILDPGERALVEGIAYKGGSPIPGARGAAIMKKVYQLNPDYDPSDTEAYKHVKTALAGDHSLNALDVAYGHIRRAKEHVPDNFDSPSVNRIKQAFLTGTGSDTLTAFESDMLHAALETAKVLGETSEAGRQTIEHLLSPAGSKAQILARLEETEHLLAGKAEASQRQIDRITPKGKHFNVMPQGSQAAEGETVQMKDKAGVLHDIPVAMVHAAETDPDEPLVRVR